MATKEAARTARAQATVNLERDCSRNCLSTTRVGVGAAGFAERTRGPAIVDSAHVVDGNIARPGGQIFRRHHICLEQYVP
jgi:hypothetical protein